MLQVRAYTKGTSGVNEPHTDYVLEEPAAVPPPATPPDPCQGYADDEQTKRAAPKEVIEQLLRCQPQAGCQQPEQQLNNDGAVVVQPYYQGSVAKARREIFYRQAGLAKELSRMGLPPMTSNLSAGKMVTPPSDDSAEQANSSGRLPSGQVPSRNPILQHERKVKALMRRQQGAQSSRPPLEPDTDADSTLTTLMARLLLVDGVRHVRMEGVPVGVKGRQSDTAPSNETSGGNLSVERVRQLMQAQAAAKRNKQDVAAAQDQEHNVRLAKLAVELLHIQEAGCGLGVPIPLSGSQITAASPFYCSAAGKKASKTAGAATSSAPADRTAKQHCAPKVITQKKGEGPKPVSIVLYPLAKADVARYGTRQQTPPALQQEDRGKKEQQQQLGSKVQPAIQVVETSSSTPVPSRELVPGTMPQQVQQQAEGAQQQGPPGVQPTTAATMQAQSGSGAALETPAALQRDGGGAVTTAGGAAAANLPHIQPAAASLLAEAAPGQGAQSGTTDGRTLQGLERFQDLSDDEYDGQPCCSGAVSSSDEGSWGIDSQTADSCGFPVHVQQSNITGPVQRRGADITEQPTTRPNQQVVLGSQAGLQTSSTQCGVDSAAGKEGGHVGIRTKMQKEQGAAAGQKVGRQDHQQQVHQVHCYQWPLRQPHAVAPMPACDADSDVDSTGSWGVEK